MASNFLLLACVCAVAASIANVQALSAVPPPRWGGNNATVGWSSVGNKTTVQSDGSSATWTVRGLCISHGQPGTPVLRGARVLFWREGGAAGATARFTIIFVCWFCQLAYYYNSALKASRYSNSNGQFTFACQGFDTQPASSACDMINAPDGHLYILFPTTEYAPATLHCTRCL